MDKMLETTIQDRISNFPDSLLIHILSWLDTKQVVRTSILSKRWRYIWASVPVLRFEYGEDHVEKISKFVAWVNRTLLLHTNTAIQKLLFDFNYHDCFASDVDAWIRFATDRKVGDLNLHLRCSYYSLPQSVYCNPSLIRLSIYNCNVLPKGSLSWSSLQSLTIAYVNLNDDTISEILLGSPSLRYLNIHGCRGINRLDINSRCLRNMVMYCWRNEPLLEISAPNLQYLRIWGRLGRQILLKSALSLGKAHLDISFDEENEKQCSYFIELVESLQNVEELELGLQSIQALILLEAKGMQSPLSRLTCLKLNANVDRQDIPGIITLLKCSPNLETLVVNRIYNGSRSLCSLNFLKQVENYWSSRTRVEKFPLPHLRTVKFLGFKNLEDVDKFTYILVQVLLENAELLGRTVINAGEYQMSVTHRVV